MRDDLREAYEILVEVVETLKKKVTDTDFPWMSLNKM